ncbi:MULTISPECIES: DRTGG domain-containing protein [Paenibacillus]|uniref:DRTGG domain-containing protein n=1 Tax=Paenibacillus chondroitinus TaxID=59842 RepID=A0ABU6DJL3_9BACL|nr:MULTISPECIES: DRTGG domain-containing protein [Paenibacillus]MCY9663249.1 DRTGG domain-containing protein [Paenibacillus anseongense]MEB4797046.1 DRTGG domain-containing protein [Paenibacillus chondroitinus]
MDTQSVDALTKHEQILRHIESLKLGSRISVRKIAKNMEVSEGTAYRAIKEAENQGLVSTKERIGTVRVEKKLRQNIDKLTFAEVVNMVDGQVLGGSRGLHKTLNKFVIGAMEQDAMMRYIEAGSLLIVGNRNEAHSCALEYGAGVLITGGFDTSAEVKLLADKLELPIISSSYDTFTVASMINRAIYDRLIKKKIMLVEDILASGASLYALKANSTLRDWQRLSEDTGYSRFPVVDEWNRIIGVVTSKDMVGANALQTVDKLMTRSPLTVTPQTSVASAAHMMVWEGIELLPVVDLNRKMVGVLNRSDVLKAMQYIQKQPQNGETFEDLIWSGLEEVRDEKGTLQFHGVITPQMTNHLGTVSEGVLTTLMTQAAYRIVQEFKKGDLVMDNMSTYFLKPLQIDSKIEIRPTIIEVSRKFGKIDVEIYHAGALVSKAMLTAQVI